MPNGKKKNCLLTRSVKKMLTQVVKSTVQGRKKNRPRRESKPSPFENVTCGNKK